MKTLAFTLLSIAALSADPVRADVIRCRFTEPFYSTEFSTWKCRLKITGAELPDPILQKRIHREKVSDTEFELRDRDGKLVQRLLLTGKGSDGMSDVLYPFEAHWYLNGEDEAPLVGGCDSKKHPLGSSVRASND